MPVSVLPDSKRLYLYDRIINITLYHATDSNKTIRIKCPSSGMKPDITLSITEIPGNVCFQAVVQIRNLILGDVRNYKTMSIEAGYYGAQGSQTNKIIFNMDIFSGYNESPNPDGITTFNGLVVGQITGFLIDRPVHIQITEDSTYKELVEKVVAGASLGNMTPVNYMFLDMKYELSRKSNGEVIPEYVDCGNGYAAIMWLQNKLFNLGKQLLGYPIFLIVWDKLAYVIPLDYNAADKDMFGKFPITNLDAITKASFAGPALSVIAPWVPQVLPGSLIRMKPNYYTGERLPNIIPVEDITNLQNLYYVIKNDIKFSTVGNTNQMQISAIPVQYIIEGDGLLTYKTPRITASEMETLRKQYLEKHDDLKDWEIVLIGHAASQGGQVPTELKSYWRYADDSFQSMGPGKDVNIGDVKKILSCISNSWLGVAQQIYGGLGSTERQSDSIWVVKKEDLIDRYGEAKYRQICRDPRVDIRPSDKTIRIPRYYFWPLIMLGTYWQYKRHNNKGPYGTRLIIDNDKLKDELVLDMIDPDIINHPTVGWVPTLTIDMIEGGQIDSFAPAFISFGKYYINKYKDSAEYKNKYIFGKQTYLVGVCLGGYNE